MIAVKKCRIGLDVDGVLLRENPSALLAYARDHFGWPVDIEGFEETNNWGVGAPGKTGAEIGEVFAQYLMHHPDHQKGIPGAYEFLLAFADVCEYVLVTARQSFLRNVTFEALEQAYPGIRFTPAAWDAYGIKGNIIPSLDLVSYTDDSAPEIQRIIERPGLTTPIVRFPNPAVRFLPVEHPQVFQLEACNRLLEPEPLTPQCLTTMYTLAWTQKETHLMTLL